MWEVAALAWRFSKAISDGKYSPQVLFTPDWNSLCVRRVLLNEKCQPPRLVLILFRSFSRSQSQPACFSSNLISLFSQRPHCWHTHTRCSSFVLVSYGVKNVIDITQSLMYGSSTKLIQAAADEEGETGKRGEFRIAMLPRVEEFAEARKKSSCGGAFECTSHRSGFLCENVKFSTF